MIKKFLIFFILVFAFVAGFYFYKNYDFKNISGELTRNIPKIEKIFSDIIQETENKISNPPPLIAKDESLISHLTHDGTIEFANEERIKNNLSPYRENELLNSAALVKVKDMFDLQYFAHESPQGKDVSSLAKDSGYKYISVGENLAMGNFKDDEALVAAWMASPGHRANILDPKFIDMGVAVMRGRYKGKNVWMAVQEFGRPVTDCPRVDLSLKESIDTNSKSLKELEKTLEGQRTEIEIRDKSDPQYNQSVKEYNELVDQYERFFKETQKLVADYNGQVKKFNACALE